MMVIEHTAQRITAVAQQMPPVGDLNGLRRPLAGSIGVGAGTIADDDLDRRMVLEPRGQGLGRAVGQQVDPAPALEITEDRAVAGWPLRQAQSSTPRTRGGSGGSRSASRMRRNRVVAPTGMPVRVARRAPGLPPSARAMA